MSDQVRNDMSHPLYEWTQVVTHEELHQMATEMQDNYLRTPWHHWRSRLRFMGALTVLKVILIWLHHGKPATLSESDIFGGKK